MPEKNANGQKPARKGSRKGKGNIPIETKAEMVAALPLADGCKSEVARQFGVDEAVVRRAAADPQISELSEIKKEQIAWKLGKLVDKLTQRFLDIAEDATLDNKAAVLLGIAADKHRLYSEEPTQITEARGDETMRTAANRALALIRERLQCDHEAAFEYLQRQKPELARYVQ